MTLSAVPAGPPRTRFAPTPSGFLHAGNAWSLLLTWLSARSRGGSIHLRIDDLDAARFREEYLEDVFSALDWLGLDWDTGPRDAADFRAGFSQRSRLKAYAEALEALCGRVTAEGPAVYACACSREKARRDSESAGLNGLYAGTCRDAGIPMREGFPLRLRVPGNAVVTVYDELAGWIRLEPGREMGDFVIRQRNGDPSYQLASLVDDGLYGIDSVVRGLDLLPSTGAQIHLAGLLGMDGFARARFLHHGLLVGADGDKLSKSAGSVSLRTMRERMDGPGRLLAWFASRLGTEKGAFTSARDLLDGFDVGRIPREPLQWGELAGDLGLA